MASFATCHALLALFCCLIVLDHVMTGSLPRRHGVVEPTDPLVFLGDDLHLICRLTDDGIEENSSSMYFQKHSERTISSHFTTQLDSRAIQLQYPIRKVEDEGSYYCYVNRSLGGPLRVDHQRIRVFRPVQKVESIDCQVYNWQSMMCRWDLGARYHHPEYINVSLAWVIDYSGSQIYDCPHLTPTSCEWRQHDERDSFRPDVTYRMRIIVLNTVTMNETMSPVFTVKTRYKVKPAKVRDISLISLNSTCLDVIWKNDQRYRTKICSIWLQSKWDKDKILKDVTTSEKTRENAVFCGLVPHAKYKMGISCRPEYKGFRSDESNLTHRMPEDVPAAAPEIAIGSFTETPCEQADCRQVTVYWKPVEEKKRNGQITAYRLAVGKNSHDISDVNRNAGVLDLLWDKDYDISVTAGTKAGLSLKYSTVKIRSRKHKPESPRVFYAVARDIDTRPLKIDLRWEKPVNSEYVLKTYTIYYCQGYRSTQSCKGDGVSIDGDLQWFRVPANVTSHSLSLHEQMGAEVFDSYMFGISADTANASSGLIWSACTYINNRKPSTPPKGFRFADPKGDLSLTLLWEHYGCQESGPVVYYKLEYCPVSHNNSCNGPVKTAEVDSNSVSYALRHLVPQTRYGVSIQAVLDSDMGPKHDLIFATAVSIGTSLDPGEIAGIAIGVLFLLCFAVFGCFVCVRRWTKPSPPPEFITPPPLPDGDPFDSYCDDYNVISSPPESPTSRTSLLSNGHSTLLSSGSESTGVHATDESGQVQILQTSHQNGHISNGSVKSVDKVDKFSDKKKNKNKALMPEGYSRFGHDTGTGSSCNGMSNGHVQSGHANTLPNSLFRPLENINKEAVVLFTTVCSPKKLEQLAYNEKHSNTLPSSQFQQNLNFNNTSCGNLDESSSGGGTMPSSGNSVPTGSYIKIAPGEGSPNVGSAVSLASSGGLRRRKSPPPMRCSSTDRELSDLDGGYEVPVITPFSTSTPIGTFLNPRNLQQCSSGPEPEMDQSYIQHTPVVTDTRSLPSILECGRTSPRRHSMEDHETMNMMSAPSTTCGENIMSAPSTTCGETGGTIPLESSNSTKDNKTSAMDHTDAGTCTNDQHRSEDSAAITGYLPFRDGEPFQPIKPVMGDYLRLPGIGEDKMNNDSPNTSEQAVLNNSALGNMSCASVVRPISNYMRDLPAQYFLDPQAFDDLPTTEL